MNFLKPLLNLWISWITPKPVETLKTRFEQHPDWQECHDGFIHKSGTVEVDLESLEYLEGMLGLHTVEDVIEAYNFPLY